MTTTLSVPHGTMNPHSPYTGLYAVASHDNLSSSQLHPNHAYATSSPHFVDKPATPVHASAGHGHHGPFIFHRCMKGFVAFAVLWEILMVVLFAIFSGYGEDADAKHVSDEANIISGSFYAFFQDVHVMIFIGFGFLMTFLKRYGYGAVGFTLLISAMCLQWHMLVNPFWHNVFASEHAWEHKIELSIELLLISDFCAGAVMITFGGLLGKVSPLQLAVIACFEVVLYALNENIGLKLAVADIGGTTVIHMFGAYFGMAATRVLSNRKDSGHPKNGAVYHSDLFAMIGTVYLWLFWPSFNGAPAVTATQQHRAVINTLLSLTGATLSAFAMSALLRHDHRFNMVDVQNATLAGGVAMGASADLYVGGGWAILIGCGAGVLSVVGYTYIMPFLEHKLGFLDTCGINNLHGMPSVYGAIIGAVYAAGADYETYSHDLVQIYRKRGEFGEERSASKQAGIQLAFIAITLGISIGGGLVVGAIANLPFFRGPQGSAFEDADFWEVPEEEIDEQKHAVDILEQRILALEAFYQQRGLLVPYHP